MHCRSTALRQRATDATNATAPYRIHILCVRVCVWMCVNVCVCVCVCKGVSIALFNKNERKQTQTRLKGTLRIKSWKEKKNYPGWSSNGEMVEVSSRSCLKPSSLSSTSFTSASSVRSTTNSSLEGWRTKKMMIIK